MDVVYGTDARVASVTHSLNGTPFSSFAYSTQGGGPINAAVKTGA